MFFSDKDLKRVLRSFTSPSMVWSWGSWTVGGTGAGGGGGVEGMKKRQNIMKRPTRKDPERRTRFTLFLLASKGRHLNRLGLFKSIVIFLNS